MTMEATAASSVAVAADADADADAQRILVTGGAGFVGGAIVDALVELHPSWHVLVTDIKPEHDDGRSQVEYHQLNVLDAEDSKRVVCKLSPTAIVHTAGVVPGGLDRYGRNPRVVESTWALNVNGTRHMIDAALAAGVRYFVQTSSCCTITDDLAHDYPNFDERVPFPSSGLIYGESKAAAEKVALDANDPPRLSVTALRPSTILGVGDYQLVPAIQACIDKFETPFIIGDGDNLYDFSYVTNVADSHVLALENLLGLQPGRPSCAGEAILISNDQPITFRDFCLAIWSHWDHVPPFQMTIPRGLAWLAGAAAEAWGFVAGGRATLCRGSVKDAYGTRYCSQVKAKKYLGYEPRVPLWEGLRISCEALKLRQAEAKRLAAK